MAPGLEGLTTIALPVLHDAHQVLAISQLATPFLLLATLRSQKIQALDSRTWLARRLRLETPHKTDTDPRPECKGEGN